MPWSAIHKEETSHILWLNLSLWSIPSIYCKNKNDILCDLTIGIPLIFKDTSVIAFAIPRIKKQSLRKTFKHNKFQYIQNQYYTIEKKSTLHTDSHFH